MAVSQAQTPEMLPQIVSITPLRGDGSLVLKKVVRDYLGLRAGGALGVRIGDEVWLTSSPESAQGSAALAVDRRGRVQLPSEVLEALGAGEIGQVALVQRPNALAVKWVSIELTEGSFARFTDIETATSITRRVEANPMPGTVLPELAAQAAELRLRAGVAAYLRDRPSYHAWCARRAMGLPDPDDAALSETLIDERLAGQRDDGAWGAEDGSPVQTARMLRELADLGIGGDHPDVQVAVAWLLERPRSIYNPGQWFGQDVLVAEQASVVAERAATRRGARPRFRMLRASEKRRVGEGDDLTVAPCGPRIMWPSALVLEAMLRLGYEDAPRVQVALSFMLTQDWCECGYQHGTGDRTERQPFGGDRLAAFEERCKNDYRYARLTDPYEILERDLAHWPVRFQRIAGCSAPSADDASAAEVYTLKIDRHIQGCEFITTRSLASVRDPTRRRFAEAHLW
ncbi:MAG: hypothetical protein MUQ10_06730, partial [Anaerolineae bacterium]|nr:hypothetical protein [Anaerolineae bacterium]